MSDWVPFEGMWEDFDRAKLARAGTQIRVQLKHYGGGYLDPTEYLIGDMNECGGGCGCCGMVDYTTKVIAYRVLLADSEAPAAPPSPSRKR